VLVLNGNSILVNSVDDWLLNLLAACSEVECNNVLMLTWRVWQLRSDAVHGKEIPTIEAPSLFFESYMQSITQTKYYSVDEIIKGKMPVGFLYCVDLGGSSLLLLGLLRQIIDLLFRWTVLIHRRTELRRQV